MTLSAPQLPEIDDRQLDDRFYKCVDMPLAHLELLKDAEEQIKTSFLASHRQTAEALSRVEDLVSPSLFEEWTVARFGWNLATVNGIKAALPAAEKQVAQLKSERNKQIRKMREEGMTQKQAADAVGVSREAVKKMESPEKVPGAITGDSPKKGRPAKSSKLSSEDEKVIIQRLAAGETKATLAKEFKVGPSTIARAVERAGRKPPAAVLPDKKSSGTTVAHSESNHSPPLRHLRDPKHPAGMAAEQHKKSFFNAVGRLFKELDRADKALLGLQNTLGEDFSAYHGAMLARWAAYEKVWADELYDSCAADTFDGVVMSLQARLKNTGKRAKESLSHLERIKTVPITIEE